MIVMRELRKAGYETRDVLEAENGRLAFDRIQEGGVDLVLSDWNMPEMTGIDLLKALREGGNEVPFGFVTSESTPSMHRDALDAGADFVVTKPFSADSLSTQVERVLEGRRQADGLGAATADEHLSLVNILSDLLGHKVAATPCEPPRLGSPGVIGLYRSATETTTTLFVAELGVAAAVGAALSRVPPGAAEDFVAEGTLPDVILQNLHEVLNVLSKVVPGKDERWWLDEMQVHQVLNDHDHISSTTSPSWLQPLEIKVAGYPFGRAGFLTV
jgi:CheY-like chemotaxis protein